MAAEVGTSKTRGGEFRVAQ